MFGSKLNVSKLVSVIKELGPLIGVVVDALRDGRIDAVEAREIGEQFVAVIVLVLDK